MDRERLADWCDHAILALVLSILVFGPLATGAVRALEFLVVQGLTVAAVGVFIARVWLARDLRLLWPPVAWAVLAFLAYAVVRYQQAPLEYVAREELVRVVVYSLLFVIILNTLHRQEFVTVVVYTLVFLALAIAVYAGYQFATDSNKVWHFIRPEQYDQRGSGTYICPNHLAGFLEMVLPLGLAYTLTGRIGHVPRIFLGYATLVILAGIGFSISRGGWLATGLSLLCFFGLLVRRHEYRIPALVCLLVLVACGVGFVAKAKHSRERFQEMFAAGKLENVRFRLWKPALQIWREAPWLGVGPGHFDYRFRAYRPEDVQMRPYRVHNDYLNTLTDWGVVGLGLAAAGWGLLGWGVQRSWKFAQRSNDLAIRRGNRSAFLLGAGVGLLALLFHSFVDFNLHIPANAILAVCLAAILASHIRFATERFWVRFRLFHRGALTACLLAALGYLGYQWERRWQEYNHLETARLAEEESKQLVASLRKLDQFSAAYEGRRSDILRADERALSALRQAHAVEPTNFETTYRIGEAIRAVSWQGATGYRQLAEEAMEWFSRTIELNPWDGYAHLRMGMCLEWLRRSDEAGPYFDRALALDPNGYYTVAHIGWRLFGMGKFEESRSWFERSLRLKPHLREDDNPVAHSYLNLVNRRLSEPVRL